MRVSFHVSRDAPSHAVVVVAVALAGALVACGGDTEGAGAGDPTVDAGPGSGDSGEVPDGGVEPGDAGVSDPWPSDPQPGQFAWARLIPGGRDQVVMSVAPDESILVAAEHAGPIAIGDVDIGPPRGRGIVVFKLTADATPIWVRAFDGADRVYLQDIAATSDGGVVLGGVFAGDGFDFGLGPVPASGHDDGFLVRLNGDSGAPEWVKAFAGRGGKVAAIEAGPDGSTYVYGELDEETLVDGDPFGAGAFLARYEGDGTRRWAQTFAASPEWQGPMALDPERGPVIAGRFGLPLQLGDELLSVDPGDLDERDTFVAGFDFDGNVRFARQVFDESSANPSGLAIAPDGDIYLAGHTTGQVVIDGHTIWNAANYSDDMYLLRLTSGGRYVWSTAIRGQAPETSRGVAVDAQGGVYTIGQCNGRVDVWPEIPCAAYDGNVIVSYGPDDEYRWSTYLEPAWAEAVVAAPGGRIYVAGDASLRSPIDFGGVRIDGQGLFVAALVPGVVVDSTPPPEPEIEAVRLDGILDGEIRQGGTATMVVAGSHLDEVTSARLGGIDLRLVARSATELHLAVVIPHGHDLGALALVVRNAGGTARIDDAVRVTPVVVAPSGGDTGRGTYASPFALCRDDWSTLVKRTDILRLGGGSHRCRDSVGIPRGVIVEGENRANTIVQFKALRGLETTSGFHGTTEYRALAIEGTESHSILVSTGNVAVTDVDVRDGGGVRVESSGTATLTRYRYRGRQVALLMFRGTVVADGVDVDSDFLGLYMKDGVLRIAESTIQTGGQCAVLAGDPNGAPTQLGRQLTIANSSIRSGACGVKTYGADLVIRDSVVETTDDSAGPTVQVFSGTAWITGSTITGKDPLASGLFMNDWFLVDPRAPTATLEDVVVEAGAGIWYGTHEGSTRLTVRRTRARSAFDTLTVFGPFGAVDLGTPDSPGENELDSETGFPLVDRRSGTGAPIDARGTRLNGTSFTGSVTGPVEVPGTYRIDGPNVLRF